EAAKQDGTRDVGCSWNRLPFCLELRSRSSCGGYRVFAVAGAVNPDRVIPSAWTGKRSHQPAVADRPARPPSACPVPWRPGRPGIHPALLAMAIARIAKPDELAAPRRVRLPERWVSDRPMILKRATLTGKEELEYGRR